VLGTDQRVPVRAVGQLPSARGWLGRLRWPAALAALTIGLAYAYLLVSRTQRTESDGASIAIQAWDVLHGNLILRGWILPDVSFYTTELPEYMIVEVCRGLSADVLHVAAALTYALLVLLAMLVAKGRTTGREAVVRMLIAGGILLAPEPGPGVFLVVNQPDHLGTQVPVLATLLLLEYAPRRWYTPVAIGVSLAWIGVADQIVWLAVAFPLAAVCGLRYLSNRAASRYELMLAAGSLASVPAAMAAMRMISALGGYHMQPLSSGLSSLATLPQHLRLGGDGLLGLYGAYASPWPFGLSYLFALLHLVGVGLALCGCWLVIRRFFSGDDVIAQVLVAGIAANVVVFLLSARPTAYWGIREIAFVLPAGAVIAGRVVGPRLLAGGWASRLLPGLAVVLAGYAAALGYAASMPAQAGVGQDLVIWLRAHDAGLGLTRYGLSAYQEGNAATMAAGDTVGLRPVMAVHGRLAPGPREYNLAWYNPTQANVNFVVIGHDKRGEFDAITPAQARTSFGTPAHVYRYGRYVIMVWNKNLLAHLGAPVLH
jgi:hypothetical protein